LPAAVTFVLMAVLWQLVAINNPYMLPTLEAIAGSIAEDPQMYLDNLFVTCQEIAIGAGAGIVCGFLLAVLMAEMPLIEKAAMPLIVVIMVTPVVAIAPALVVAFGFGMMPKYIVTALVVFFPMLVNSLAGLRDVDPKTLDVFKTLHASRLEIFRHLRLPGCMPFVFAGLRIALPMAVVGAAVAERFFMAFELVAGGEQRPDFAIADADMAITARVAGLGRNPRFHHPAIGGDGFFFIARNRHRQCAG